MSIAPIDIKQRDAFLADAENLDYRREEFKFESVSQVNSDTTVTDELLISRGKHRRQYRHGGTTRWLGDALKDLYAGYFGPATDEPHWNRPVLIPDGPLKGKWMADAFFKLPDNTRVDYTAPNRVFDTEAEALKAGRDWLRKHAIANR